MTGAQPPIAAIVVNWNRRDDTLRCLASLRAAAYPALTIFVVDNASTDDSCAAIRRAFPATRVIESDQNLGFAEGNNLALRQAQAEGFPYIFLLNNDATVAPDALHLLLRHLHDNPTLGVVGPAIYYLDTPNTIWSAGGTIERQTGTVSSPWHDKLTAALPNAPQAVDHISGCAMLLRTEAISRAGLIDRRFFMYYEETEWCARIARQGYGIALVPQARVWHEIDPQAQAGSPAIAYYMTRNHLLFLRATHAPPRAWRHTLYHQLRTIASLYLTKQSAARVRGRRPMLLALRDFTLGRFGPTTLPRTAQPASSLPRTSQTRKVTDA